MGALGLSVLLLAVDRVEVLLVVEWVLLLYVNSLSSASELVDFCA